MDILSHGLYGSIAFGRKNRKSFWLAFLFGISPDLFSFGIFFIERIFLWEGGGGFKGGPPDPSTIPSYIYSLYNLTHSFVIFGIIFALVYWIRKKPLMEMLAWPLHILVDIPTHSTQFFPTPFLWPISDYNFNGIGWGDPRIFILNVILILSLYIWYYVIRTRRHKKQLPKVN